MSTLIGPLVGFTDVEDAMLEVLRTWLDVYLAEVESQHDFQKGSIERPPTPESFHGGTAEAISWKQDELPAVIVVVEPEGEPEVSASAGYIQPFDVMVFAIATGDTALEDVDPEDAARKQVGYYGAAIQGILQQGTLMAHALPSMEWMRITGAPRVETPDPTKRHEQACVTTFKIWVAPILVQEDGPVGLTPAESPGYTGAEEPFEDAPTAKDGEVTVIATPTATPL
jgi:hypothetical protein